MAEPPAQRPRLWFDIDPIPPPATSNGFVLIDEKLWDVDRPNAALRTLLNGAYWRISSHMRSAGPLEDFGPCPCFKRVRVDANDPDVYLYRSRNADGWWFARDPVHTSKEADHYLGWHADINPLATGLMPSTAWHIPCQSPAPDADFKLVPYYDWLIDMQDNVKRDREAVESSNAELRIQLDAALVASKAFENRAAELEATCARQDEDLVGYSKAQRVVKSWDDWWEAEGKHLETSLQEWVDWADKHDVGKHKSFSAASDKAAGSGEKTGWFNRARELMDAIFSTQLDVPQHIFDLAKKMAV